MNKTSPKIQKNRKIRLQKKEVFRKRPSASECTQTHPNASEQVQRGSNTSENFEELTKT